MPTFKEQAAQGDMLIRLVDKLPNGLKPIDAEAGNYVLAHSETGHNHVVKVQDGVEFYANQNNPFIAYLVIDPKKVKGDVQIKHLRDYDTHKPISFFIGDTFIKIKDKAKKIYEIRRQREYTPEGFRRAQD